MNNSLKLKHINYKNVEDFNDDIGIILSIITNKLNKDLSLHICHIKEFFIECIKCIQCNFNLILNYIVMIKKEYFINNEVYNNTITYYNSKNNLYDNYNKLINSYYELFNEYKNDYKNNYISIDTELNKINFILNNKEYNEDIKNSLLSDDNILNIQNKINKHVKFFNNINMLLDKLIDYLNNIKDII